MCSDTGFNVKGAFMKHHLEWKGSRLDIRCWECGEILLSISTDGSSLVFDALPDRFEIRCPECRIGCEYDLYESRFGSFFRAHDWDADIDSGDFEGEFGERIRQLLKDYKTLLLEDEFNKKFFENEFHVVTDFLEYLCRQGLDGSVKSKDAIDGYIDDCDKYEFMSKNMEKQFRRAINRFYRLREAEKP